MDQTVRERSNLDPNLVEDVCVGNVLAPGSAYVARSAVLAAGFPVTAAASIANRFCSSGLLAIQSIANQIIAGSIDVGIAVGAESMSTTPDSGAPEMSQEIMNHPLASQNKQPMGQTSENVAAEFNLSREALDRFAANSYQKAEQAQKAGWSSDEIAPVRTQVKDPKTGEVKDVVVDRDDGIRYGTTAEGLGKIRPAFPQWKPSITTGGNASQITDGAAGLVLMKRSRAEQLGQPIVGKFCGATVAGLEPRIMGIGPSIAIPKILTKFGLSKEEVDIFEINEAFASMVGFHIFYCWVSMVSLTFILGNLLCPEVGSRRGQGQPPRWRNVRLYSIFLFNNDTNSNSALGHPLGCTGARQVVTALSELRRQNKRVAVTSMCVGTVRIYDLPLIPHILTDLSRAWVWPVCLCRSIRWDESGIVYIDLIVESTQCMYRNLAMNRLFSSEVVAWSGYHGLVIVYLSMRMSAIYIVHDSRHHHYYNTVLPCVRQLVCFNEHGSDEPYYSF